MGIRPLAIALACAAPLACQEPAGALAEKIIRFHQQPSTAAQRARTPLPSDSARIVRHVRPRDADPAVTQFLLDHYAMLYRGVPKNGLLFLFFPGTFGWPQHTQFVLDTAARGGYLALGLEYVNTTLDPRRTSVITLCSEDPDTTCAGKVRQERMFGEDASDKVEVGRADSIVSRVEKALALLSRTYPEDGWDRFLAGDGRVRWDRVAAGGHSQGAGMAAYLAKKFELARVCLFSGGGDFSRPARRFAEWLARPGATPGARFFGMLHEKEKNARGIRKGYRLLGLGDERVAVVSLPPAPGASLADPEHGSTASDSTTPKDSDGSPSYRKVWQFLIGAKATP
jgi:hypothetical protein